VLQSPDYIVLQPRLNKGRMLGLHKLHLTTNQTGDVINIFASIKICP